MTERPSDLAFTPTVKALQTAHGSREAYARMEAGRGWATTITPELAAYVAELDMAYLATATAGGQPYVQYRGGPRGFLQVLDAHTLAFVDFAGNQQFLSWGNLEDNPRAFLFLVDYARRRRIKVWGTARVVTDDPALLARLRDPSYPGRPERAVVFTVEAFDVNCPQHIHPRVRVDEVQPRIAALEARIAELEAELARGSEEG
jgi:hypothetical protein